MYSFGTDTDDQSGVLEDSQALQDIVAEQSTSLNALQQLTDSLRRDTASLKSVTVEQQRHIDQLQQQVFCMPYLLAYHIYIANLIFLPSSVYICILISCQIHDLSSQHPTEVAAD